MANQLPVAVDAERMVLGSILLDDSRFTDVAGVLRAEEFSMDKHRRIFTRMYGLHERGEKIDRITIFNELQAYGELEACDGLGYLISLDDGLPQIPNIGSYVRIIREKAALRRIMLLGNKAQGLASQEQHSAVKIARDLAKELIRMEVSLDQRKTLLTPEDIINEHGGIDHFYANALKPGISCGFPQIDDAIMGLQEGCHYIVAGRTGSGKTAAALNIAVNVAKSGHPTAIFSLEMSKELLLVRALCAEAEVPFKAYIKQDMDAMQRHAIQDALHTINNIPLFIDDYAGLTITEFVARVDRAVADHKIRLFLLDYLQLLNADKDDKSIRNEYDRVTLASSTCRMLCRKHGNSCIGLSQLKRPSDTKRHNERPNLSDLKASGGIENDAAAVMLIHRPEMFERNKPELFRKAEVILGKSRVGGSGTVHMEFIGKYYKFVDNGPPADEE